MPDTNYDATNAAAISGSAQVLGSTINAMAASNLNSKTQEFSEHMYDRSREASLHDWNMVNEYNSPQAQMARLKAAGLNPNLVYGGGNQMAAAQSPRATDTPQWHPEAPKIDLSGISTIAQAGLARLDYQTRQQNLDNLKTANTVAQQDALLKAAQTTQTTAQTAATTASQAQTESNTAMNQFDLQVKKQMLPNSLQLAQANLDKINAETDKLIADIGFTNQQKDINASQNRLSLQLGEKTVQEAVQRIIQSKLTQAKTEWETSNLQQQLLNANKDGQLKQIDINLRKNGVVPTDNVLLRMGAQYLNTHDVHKPTQLQNYRQGAFIKR